MTIDIFTILLPIIMIFIIIFIIIKEQKTMIATKIAIYSFIFAVISAFIQFGLFDERFNVFEYSNQIEGLLINITSISLIISFYRKEIEKNMNNFVRIAIYVILLFPLLSIVLPQLKPFISITLLFITIIIFTTIIKNYQIFFYENKGILILLSMMASFLLYQSLSSERKARKVVQSRLMDNLWEKMDIYINKGKDKEDRDKRYDRYLLVKKRYKILGSKIDANNNIEVYFVGSPEHGYYLVNGITLEIMKEFSVEK